MTSNLAQRIWQKDASAWTDDPAAQEQIPGALGWLDLPLRAANEIDQLASFAEGVCAAGFSDVTLLGMGGSSLCPEVLRQTFGSAPGYPKLSVLDTTNPDTIRSAEQGVNLSRTLFLVSSKSGGTLETTSLFRYFFARLEAVQGTEAGQHFVALTDPGTSIEQLAREHKFRRVFSTPADVGGRYAALTTFGLLPAALIGMDLGKLAARARSMMEACAGGIRESDNPGLQLGLKLADLARRGHDKVTLVVSPAIAGFGLWVEQLLAESTGKEGRGLIPVADEPLGSPDAYGQDRVFVHLRLPGDDDSTMRALDRLESAGHPVVRLELTDRYDLGAEFYRWEFATAVAGTVLRINAFDQPNVQESKDNTAAVLSDWLKSGTTADDDPDPNYALVELVSHASASDYVALMAYVPPSSQTNELLQSLRVVIGDSRHVATTVGYGPRFLHSTGQLHKGGPNSGLFVQLVASPREDFDIPGEPYSFGTLLKAQAIGDLHSLRTHGRRVVRLDLGANVERGLAQLKSLVQDSAKLAR